MSAKKNHVKFKGHKEMLSAIISMPESKPKAYVLYAHCFTCGKDFTASARMSRALVKQGFAVFRFDFTGIGASLGDFSDTNFSTNVLDIVAAANFMREQYQAPDLLIGHSLGGTASIKAAINIPEVKAVSCLSSPANPRHIKHLFSQWLNEIKLNGQVNVELAGREFTIKQQFIDDLDSQGTTHIGEMDKALLVMHSPLDKVVAIEEAEKIYVKAKHPKSFVSLDTADHLLSNREDIQYAVAVITAWSSRFL
jgi:putative redox protein